MRQKTSHESPSGLLLLAAAALVAATLPGSSGARAARPQRLEPLAVVEAVPLYAPDEILVRYRPGIPEAQMRSSHAAVGASVKKRYTLVENLVLVELPPGMDVRRAVELYGRDPNVLYAEPNWEYRTLRVPNDARFGELWGLHNTGQAGRAEVGRPGADIDAVRAWNLSRGRKDVVVAVIDTGIDYEHEDLAANVFRNRRDCDGDGRDDDGNGYADDCHGIDTFNGDADPLDDNGHGTHVAGTIGAVGNNRKGVVGVNWQVQIMACKFLSAGGWGRLDGAIECLEYIAAMASRGAKVVATNNSWGGSGFSQALMDAIDAHLQRGILFFAAAGNSSGNNDFEDVYPADYFLPNVVSVAATTRRDNLASFTNVGRRSVHLGAPGLEIPSTIPNDRYAVFSGTSMATPHATGVAALLKAHRRARDWRQIRNLILAGSERIPAMDLSVSGRRLNAFGALRCKRERVRSRLLPSNRDTAAPDEDVTLAALNILCDRPRGKTMVVRVSGPAAARVRLTDDGTGADRAKGDGLFTGGWRPSVTGPHVLDFGGDLVTIQVLKPYPQPRQVSFAYRRIGGTNLNLSDESSAVIPAPFPIRLGGEDFSLLIVNSNGSISLTDVFPVLWFFNKPLPVGQVSTLVAPFWDDFFPLPQTDQNVFVEVLGRPPNRELVVEWRDVRPFRCRGFANSGVTFQVVFFEDSSSILFNYADTVFGGECSSADRGGSATVGVQVSRGSATEFLFFRPGLDAANMSLRWELE